MSESAPLNKSSNVVRNIFIGIGVVLVALYAYGHFTHKVLNITNRGVSITQGPVKATPGTKTETVNGFQLAGQIIQSELNLLKPAPVVKAPVVAVAKPVVAQPVVATPTVAKAIQAPTLTPSQASSVVKAAGPYQNHGCFMHGNSNPSWPYSGHHIK